MCIIAVWKRAWRMRDGYWEYFLGSRVKGRGRAIGEPPGSRGRRGILGRGHRGGEREGRGGERENLFDWVLDDIRRYGITWEGRATTIS